MPETPLCPHCHQKMQVADIVWGDKKDIIAVRYVCGCKTPPTHWNWHSGDQTKEKKDA